MPRTARVLNELGYYHIVIRGVNREWIFSQDEDKQKIIELLKVKQEKLRVKLYSYCVMDNHLHILLWADPEHLWKYMHKVNLNYGMYYNYKYTRIGHVFQNRYSNENIEDKKHLLATMRYIHRNPVKAFMVERAEDYCWSSMAEYMKYSFMMIDEENGNEIMEAYFGKVEHFYEFHQEFDQGLYLDIQEEREEAIKEWVVRKLEEGASRHEIKDIHDLQRNPAALEELIVEMKEEGRLTQQEIAEQLQIDRKTVSKYLKEFRQIV